jgi:hypothetical protein
MRSHTRAGRLIQQLEGYKAFEPADLPPSPPLLSASPDSRSGWGFVSELSRSWVPELSRSFGVTASDSCGFLSVVP